MQVAIRLDRPEPGAHLIWDIINTGDQPVTLTKLIVHGRGGAATRCRCGLPKVLAPQDRITLPTDVDWTLLAAKSIAVADSTGHEHHAVEAAARRDPGSAATARSIGASTTRRRATSSPAPPTWRSAS